MNDWIVYSSDNMPKRLFNTQATIAMRGRDFGQLVIVTQRNMATNIARKIMEDKEFFSMKQLPHENIVELRASVVVLTVDEWRAEMEQQFKKGMEAGREMVSFAYCPP